MVTRFLNASMNSSLSVREIGTLPPPDLYANSGPVQAATTAAPQSAGHRLVVTFMPISPVVDCRTLPRGEQALA